MDGAATISRASGVAMSVALVLGCGGTPRPEAEAGDEPSSHAVQPKAPEGSGKTPEDAVQLCHMNGGPDRTDYSYVASYRCPSGEMPLGGDPDAGARARIGNVGAGPDGHVLDLYEIPCPGGAVRLYVDAYHCGPGVDTNVDPDNLTDEQLERMARLFRQLETAPFEDRARKLRTEGFAWLGTTDQLQVLLCQGMLNGIVGSGYEHEDMLVEQLGLSVAAATIEISDDPKNRAQVTISGIQGVVRLYRAILQHRGAPASNPRMDDLGRMLADGSIRPYIDRVLAACQASRRQQRQAQGSPRMQMQTDEGNVWPPQGPGCDELVRCCESTGLVADGGSKGPEGLMCLLGAAPPTDCEGALETLRTMGTDCGSD